jgi:hypothetical protein
MVNCNGNILAVVTGIRLVDEQSVVDTVSDKSVSAFVGTNYNSAGARLQARVYSLLSQWIMESKMTTTCNSCRVLMCISL